jgi:hypothetical protein
MLKTELVWNPKACKNGNIRRRGALEGTLLGVPVGGKDIGRSVAYQLETVNGDVHTVWWDGTVGSDDTGVWPHLYQLDTDVSISLSPSQIAWFDKLENVRV